MPLPLLLPLAVKGLAVLAKSIIVHGMAPKAGVVLLKSVAAHGFSQTVGSVLAVGIVVGGVVWAKEMVDNLQLALKALDDDNVGEAVTRFAKLAISLHSTADALPHAVHDYLKTIEVAEEKAQAVSDTIVSLRDEISNKIHQLA